MGVKHTPGPWHRQESHPIMGSAIRFDGTPVERVYTATISSELPRMQIRVETEISEGEAAANACLVEAAPELLAALKAAENWFGELGNDDGAQGLLDDIRSTIAKAEGRGDGK